MKIQIAENIKKFRVAHGYTQNDLAVLLSVSAQAVSRWENGQAFPDISLLPLIAEYLDVSIDELMGVDGNRNRELLKELRARKRAAVEGESEKVTNELRILDIYEELGRTEPYYLMDYFQQLMRAKNDVNLKANIPEDRIAHARQKIRDRLRVSNMRERMDLLLTVALCEEEEKWELWADEYELPEYMKTSVWDELLLARYKREKNADKVKRQSQKIRYEHIKNIVYYLTDSVPDHRSEREDVTQDLERYKTALDTLALYSTRVDDIFIFTRIVAEVRYAEALLINGYAEESLAMFSSAADHLRMLCDLPEGIVLHGSVSVLNTVHTAISAKDKLEKCVMVLGEYDNNPLFDNIRGDKEFVKYVESLEMFFPNKMCRSWVNEVGDDAVDATWKMLLDRARKVADTLSDGEAVVMLTAKGTVDAVTFQNEDTASDAENAMKFLIEKKKNGDAKIERLVCMWHDGSIDIASFAFREALLAIDGTNLSAKMLLNGLSGYVVKTVKVTMPRA